jgi:hypothetical protein
MAGHFHHVAACRRQAILGGADQGATNALPRCSSATTIIDMRPTGAGLCSTSIMEVLRQPTTTSPIAVISTELPAALTRATCSVACVWLTV